MGLRLKSRNLLDLVYQVALIRPGVGVQGSSVPQFVERYRHGAEWEYDHPLERRALERGYGIIVWQEQVVQLIEDVAGMTAAEADEVRRAAPTSPRGTWCGGRDGTVFVTIEDETGDVQVIVWSDLFARRRMELGSQVVKVTGRVSRWDGTTNVIATDLRAVPSGVRYPSKSV